ncbi:MAG: glutamate racemase [Ramlibacter sp.]
MAPIGGTRSADRPIGVFDSGVGGLSILKALRAELPAHDFVYFADTGHAPYGERDEAYVVERTRAIVQQLRADHAIQALVIACNTATAAAVHLVRAEHPDLPVVGVEPALKPAVALSRTRRIGVMATRGTLASHKFRLLHDSLRDQAEFILQPCDGLAYVIEQHDTEKVEALCRGFTQAIGEFGDSPDQVDTLVLGCTHYPFAWDAITASVGAGVRLIETGEPVARQTRRLLEAAGALSTGKAGAVRLLSSGSLPALKEAAERWLSLRT